MAQKTSRKAAITAGVGILAALGALALVFSILVERNGNNVGDEPAFEMGPDMAAADPTDHNDAIFGVASADDQAAGAPGAREPPVVSGSEPASTGAVRHESPWLRFEASFPEAAADDPVIAPLRADALRRLAARDAGAKEEYDLIRSEGREPNPWDVQISWTYSAKAGDVVSLLGEAMEYTGGAHPNTMFDTRIARTSGETIRVEDMMIVKRAPSPAMAIAICEGLKAEKKRRIEEETIYGEPIVCAGPASNTWVEAGKLALAPSSKPDRFGGVIVYFQPYAVGAYVEGSYEITVQQAVFADDLRPDFRHLFDGEAPVN